MPELPEVETARRLIADLALGRRIVGVDDADTYVCRPHSPGELRAALTGRTLTAARRRGKQIWCETSGVAGSAGPGPDLGIHLGMAGRIMVTAKDGWVAEGGDRAGRDAQPRKAEWDRFTLEFADGGQLALFDKRRLGRILLDPGPDRLGPDAVEVTPAEFRALISKGTIAVKARLLDQSKIAGIGNLLADEILWQAKISPTTPVSQAAAPGRRPPAARGAVGAEIRDGRGRRGAHRRSHRGPASRRPLPALRRRDGARHGRRALHLVVLARAGRVAPGPAHPGNEQ